ncbi:MAG TPA: DMT family transporter [Acidimicrobiales bacterium]|nr:DMT family transporter [Acidimicrobiales bacterium]
MNLAAATVAAMAAAATFAVSAVLQQRAARTVPPNESLSFRLLIDLIRQPSWLAGTASLVAGYCLQAVALAFGNVSFVAPLIVSELVFALPLATRLEHRRLGRREWLGAAGVVMGVGMFLLAASPGGGRPDPGLAEWVLMIVPCAVVVAAVLALAQRAAVLALAQRTVRGENTASQAGSPEAGAGAPAWPARPASAVSARRASLLAVAAGVTFGLLAVFTKGVTYIIQRHGVGVVLAWQLYALIGLGVAGFLFSQSAYQAAPLRNSLPVIDALEPTVAVLLAAAAFGEHLSHGPAALALEALGASAALGGVFVVGRSPLVLSAYEPENAAHG